MAKQLINLAITAPGFYGLNRQKSGAILPIGWASIASNLVFDDKGRFSARQGHQQQHPTAAASDFKAIHEYIDAGGNTVIIGAADNKIYKLVSGLITDISGSITTPTGDDWKFQNFNATCVGFQENHAPIVVTTTGGTFADVGGTQYQGSTVLAAFGRLWTVEANKLRFSQLLVNDFAGGTGDAASGSFDLSEYWSDGMDNAVEVIEWNNYLVVMGERNFIVYSNPDNPVSNMVIADSIGGIGLVARDCVQNIGTDVLFLSPTGVRSLGRVIQEKSLPIGDVSKNNQDFIQVLIDEAVNKIDIKSVFSRVDNLVLISFPDSGITLYFDMKGRLEDGSYRMTVWTYTPTAMMSTIDGQLYLAVDAGYISTYKKYQDSIASDGTGGNAYVVDFEGSWHDGGEQLADLVKIMKEMTILTLGGAGTVISVKWAFDYLDLFEIENITIPVATGSEFNVAEYNSEETDERFGEYSGTLIFNDLKNNLTKSGRVFKIGFLSTVDGEPISIQRIDVKAKAGRLN